MLPPLQRTNGSGSHLHPLTWEGEARPKGAFAAISTCYAALLLRTWEIEGRREPRSESNLHILFTVCIICYLING